MKKHSTLLQATLLVTTCTLLCKVLGFVREAVIASYYGATEQTDAFFFAQAMPAMIFPAVCNSISTAFTSLYVKRLTENGEEEGDGYASRMLVAAFFLGLVLGIIGILIAPWIVPLLVPGFEGPQLTLTIRLTQISMGSFLLIMLQYMMSAALNAKRHFLGAQLAGLLYNVVIIAATVLLGRYQSMEFLMLSTVGGLLLQVAAMLGCHLRYSGFHVRLRGLGGESLALVHLALPILLGNSVVQLNNIVDKALGSTLPSGSLSSLTYASNLTNVVISTLIISLSTVLYPSLTEQFSRGERAAFCTQLETALVSLSALLIPISCITMLDAESIVSAVYARGSFDQTAVAHTTAALICYAPIFFFSGIRELVSRAFFAMQDTKTPMYNSALGVLCNIVCSLALVRWLGLRGIALGTTVSTVVIGVLLLVQVQRKLPQFSLKPMLLRILRQALAAGGMSLLLAAFRALVPISLPLVRFAGDTIVGFLSYGLLLTLLGGTELKTLFAFVRKR